MPSAIKEKAVKGVTWTLIERFGINGMRFVLGIILARLLTPEDYGLIGMITVFFVVAQVFIESGFGSAYIQKKKVTDADANTVFYTNLSISVMLYGVLWLAAPAIARFYRQPALIEITRVMGLVLLINAFNVIQMAQLTRAVNFKRKTKITLTATSIAGIFGITAAYYGMGVWALVIQNMTGQILTTGGLWITSKWKPAWQFSRSALKDMFSFGFWVLFANVIQTFFDNIYLLTIGKIFPVAQLGFYTKSKQFQQASSEQIAGAVSLVAFPVFSQIQDDKAKLRNGMKKFLQHTMIFIVPLLIVLIVAAKPFVILLLTQKWAPMIPYLQLLCVAGVLYPIHLVNVQVLLAQGKSKLHFNITMIKNGLRILNIIVMYRFGVLYIIVGEVVLSFVGLLINTWFTRKLVDYGFLKQARDIWKILLSAVIAGLAGAALSMLIHNLWALFFAEIIAVGVIFTGLQYLMNQSLLIETFNLKNSLIKRA